MKASAASPLSARIIETREDGSALVEVPVIVVTDELDLSRTSGGGKGTVAITASDLAEMVANFSEWPKPVAVGFDGLDGHQDERGGPQLAFINSVHIDGGALYAVVEVSASAAGLFQRFRGFSMEARKNPKTPTKSLTGWVLTGGIFTNNPATDTQFRIAASDGEIESEERGVHSVAFQMAPARGEEYEMAEQKSAPAPGANEEIISLTARLSTQESLVSSLRTQAEGMQSESVTLTARLTEANNDLASARVALATANGQLSTINADLEYQKGQLAESENRRREAQVKLEAEQARSLKDDVMTLVGEAIDRGVSASLFEGVEADPCAWFKARYASIEALKQFLSALPTVKDSATTSGRSDATGVRAELSAETKAKFQRMGLDPKYAGIQDENELIELKGK